MSIHGWGLSIGCSSQTITEILFFIASVSLLPMSVLMSLAVSIQSDNSLSAIGSNHLSADMPKNYDSR